MCAIGSPPASKTESKYLVLCAHSNLLVTDCSPQSVVVARRRPIVMESAVGSRSRNLRQTPALRQSRSRRCFPASVVNAQLKTWRILRKLRCCPWRAGQLAKAIHVLQIREANAG